MNDILNPTATQTMSSREIAELTGKDHRNVTRDIEKMLKDVGEGVLNFEHTYRNNQNGQDYREFLLPKNLTLNLIAGYRADLRLKIIDRWMELEATPAQPPAVDLQDPDTLRGLLIDYATRTIEMKKENAVLAPKAAALDALAGMDGQHNLRLSAAQCQMKERDFTAALEREGWIYRDTRTGRLMVYARARDAGWMTVKNVTIQHRSGEREGVGQPMMTQRGLAEMQRRLVARPFTRELESAS